MFERVVYYVLDSLYIYICILNASAWRMIIKMDVKFKEELMWFFSSGFMFRLLSSPSPPLMKT